MKFKIFILLMMTVFCGLSACTIHEANSTDRSTVSDESFVSEEKSSLAETVNTEYLPLYGILINCGDWTEADEIPVTMYYAWYRDYINSVTTPEERQTLYKIDLPKYENGWAYPAGEFEDFVTRHFSVDVKYLRSREDVYQADENVYWIPAGGAAANYRMKVASDDDISADGDLLRIKVSCSAAGDFSDTAYKELTVDTASGQIRFVSCRSL